MIKVEPQPKGLDDLWGEQKIPWFKVITEPNKYHNLEEAFQLRCIDGTWYWVGKSENRR